MTQENLKKRWLSHTLPKNQAQNETARLLLITGARQTGKSTLVQHDYPKLAYYNLDDFELRDRLSTLATSAWASTIGNAIIDEAQKAPKVFEKVKFAFDAKKINFTILLGSSQILLLKKIRESLAGRIAIYELFPFMFSELITHSKNLKPPLLSAILNKKNVDELLSQQSAFLPHDETLLLQKTQDYLLQWGGMPRLTQLAENERQKWLRDYEYTYLQRDLTDLARINDLEPFKTFQRLTALRNSQLLNYSALARDAGLSIDTSRRYLEYLRISYQISLLQPFFSNHTTSLVKSPKIYWLDNGIMRSLAGMWGNPNGALFESYIVSEIYKWVHTMQSMTELFYYRTQSGREIDLILKTPHGLILAEIKYRNKVYLNDTTSLQAIAKQISEPVLAKFVIYNGELLQRIENSDVWAIPAIRLFA